MMIYLVLMAFIAITSTFLVSRTISATYIENERQKLDEAAVLFASQTYGQGEDVVKAKAKEYGQLLKMRITIISEDDSNLGKVFLDTDVSAESMENHAYREEVNQALQTGKGMSVRESKTTNTAYLYTAYSDFSIGDRNFVLRFAEPLASLNMFTHKIIVVNIAVLTGLIAVGFFIFHMLSSSVLRPLNDLSERIEDMEDKHTVGFLPKYNEGQIDQLANSFNKLMVILNEHVDQLQQNNKELAAIFENVKSGIVMLDPQAHVLVCNQQALDLFGVAAERFIDRRFFSNIRKPELIEAIRETIVEVKKQTLEIEWDNDMLYQIQLSPLMKENNVDIMGVLIVVENITDLRTVENMRKDFVANVSHELKTPLTTIRGFTETLLNDDLDDPKIIRKFLTIIDNEANRLQLMIFQLLYLSKLDSKITHEDIISIRLEDFVERIKYNFADRFAEKNINLRFSIKPSDLLYEGSENLLTQILTNLIDNALEYSQGTYILVLFEQKDNYLRIVVEDDGVGIDKKEQLRIFERFYRVEKSRAQTKGGTGLGLSIVKHLAVNSGGSVEVESDVNQGCQFIVLLPRDDKGRL